MKFIPKLSSLAALLSISIGICCYYFKLIKYKTKLNFITNEWYFFIYCPIMSLLYIPVPLVRGHLIKYSCWRRGSLYMCLLPSLATFSETVSNERLYYTSELKMYI
jgi:hypothetical protein